MLAMLASSSSLSVCAQVSLLAEGEMQQAQLLMVAGFIMLGWVLARRQIKNRKRVNRDNRSARKQLAAVREHKEPALPLADAPPETQRWQVAMFDLQRELKAELDTRIGVVQSLMRQLDQRIEYLAQLEGETPPSAEPASSSVITANQKSEVERLARSGHTATEIADRTRLPLGDVELLVSTMPLG